MRSPFLELQSGLILSRMAKPRRLGGDLPQISQKWAYRYVVVLLPGGILRTKGARSIN